jgi:hypothetical protein
LVRAGGDSALRQAAAPANAARLNVPKAHCGPHDRTESGLQGQTTLAERVSGLSELGFNCNLELVGQFQGEGSKSWHMAWFDDCAYYGTNNNPLQQHRGVVVVDASDPRRPQASAYLDTPAMLDPHESLKQNEKRQLLAAVQFNGPGFAIYDVSADCRQPVLNASVVLPGESGNAESGHAGNFAPDGLTYYATSMPGAAGGRHFSAIDVTDPSNPRYILRYPPPPGGIGAPHDISISEDGTRAYIPNRFLGNFGEGHNGLVILDVSDIQFRRPNPQVREISRLFWDDGSVVAQQTLPVTIKGRPHLIFTDESGGGAAACAQGKSPHGFARIIDISDERNPKIVSKLMLEVHDPANCPVILNDPPGPGHALSYSAHYCNVDAAKNPTMLACTYQEAGLRVFDIRDPFHPKEIAYYKPPARGTAFLPGSRLWGPGIDRTTEHTASRVRFRKHKGEQGEKDKGKIELWFTGADNAFQIVRFTEHIKAVEEDLFEDD